MSPASSRLRTGPATPTRPEESRPDYPDCKEEARNSARGTTTDSSTTIQVHSRLYTMCSPRKQKVHRPPRRRENFIRISRSVRGRDGSRRRHARASFLVDYAHVRALGMQSQEVLQAVPPLHAGSLMADYWLYGDEATAQQAAVQPSCANHAANHGRDNPYVLSLTGLLPSSLARHRQRGCRPSLEEAT